MEFPRPKEVPEGAILRVLRVHAEAAGQRLDVFVQAQLKRTSRTRAQRIVTESAFDATGRRKKPSDRVREGEQVFLWREPFEKDEEQPPLPILYEDPHLLVVDKPPLVAVHPTARYHTHTVIVRPWRRRAAFFTAAKASGRIWSRVSPCLRRPRNSSVLARSWSSVSDWYCCSNSLARATSGRTFSMYLR